MINLAGFFSSHAWYSMETIEPTIREISQTFSGEGKNILVLELTSGDHNELESLKKSSEEIFERSATETSILRLHYESLYPKSKHVYRAVTDNGFEKMAVDENTYDLRLLLEIGRLRNQIEFQVLYESCVSAELIALIKLEKEYGIRMQKATDFDDQVDSICEYFKIVDKAAAVRDGIMRSKIDGLIAKYPNLNIQVAFGTGHSNMLNPYQGREDISLRVVEFKDRLGTFLFEITKRIVSGENISLEEKRLLIINQYALVVAKILYDKCREMIHPGDIFEAMRNSVTDSELRSFSHKSQVEMLICVAKAIINSDRIVDIAVKNPRTFSVLSGLARIDNLPKNVTKTAYGKKVCRNDPCPCGSGKKYKKCCLE